MRNCILKVGRLSNHEIAQSGRKNKVSRPETNLILSHADPARGRLMFVPFLYLLNMLLVIARDLSRIQGAFNRLVLSSNLRRPIF